MGPLTVKKILNRSIFGAGDRTHELQRRAEFGAIRTVFAKVRGGRVRAKRRCFFDGGHATRQDTYLIESALSRNKTAERLLYGLSGAVSFVLVCAHSDHFQSHRTAGIRSAPLAACEGVRRLSCRLEFLVSDQTLESRLNVHMSVSD